MIPEEGERRFVFLSLPMYRGGFHFESSITAGDQSQLNSSDEYAARYKKKKDKKSCPSEKPEGGRGGERCGRGVSANEVLDFGTYVLFEISQL